MRKSAGVLTLVVAACALAWAAPANARVKALWHMQSLDTVVADVSGLPLTVEGEDDPNEWQNFFPNGTCVECVLGFTIIDVSPSSPLYHVLFLSPQVYGTFTTWQTQPVSATDAAVAIMTLIHESLHWGLFSSDEGRVNACALKDFPYVIQRDFQIPATTTQTYTYTVKVTRRVRRHGRWVRIVRSVQRTGMQVVDNPDYVSLVQAAEAFYQSQPAPYNTGTC